MAISVYSQYDAVALAQLVKSKDLSPHEVIDEAIERVEAVNPELNFLTDRGYEGDHGADELVRRRPADRPAIRRLRLR